MSVNIICFVTADCDCPLLALPTLPPTMDVHSARRQELDGKLAAGCATFSSSVSVTQLSTDGRGDPIQRTAAFPLLETHTTAATTTATRTATVPNVTAPSLKCFYWSQAIKRKSFQKVHVDVAETVFTFKTHRQERLRRSYPRMILTGL